MKTLDEVIESITTQSGLEIRNVRKPERDRFWVDRDTYNDALHYLKAYRDDRDDLTALRAFWAEQQVNPPLTGDELNCMDGKPVWIWDKTGFKDYEGWVLIGEERLVLKDSKLLTIYLPNHAETALDKADIDKTWQAYRKERL